MSDHYDKLHNAPDTTPGVNDSAPGAPDTKTGVNDTAPGAPDTKTGVNDIAPGAPDVTQNAPAAVQHYPDAVRDSREPALDIRQKKEIVLDLRDIERSTQLSRALSSEVRLKILRILIDKPMTVSQLAELFYLPVSSMSMHVKILSEAELITVVSQPGLHGTKKVCGIAASTVTFDLFSHATHIVKKPPAYVNMPVGHYSRCQVEPPCGIVSSTFYLGKEDSPYGFYMPEHVDASLLWFQSGFLEYQFPNDSLREAPVNQVEFSFEICAEAPGYNNDWPSDIDFSINEIPVTTLRIKGDYGGRRGIYNPAWWSNTSTQFGEYIILHITHDGCYMADRRISDHTISSLHMLDNYYFTMHLGVDRTAQHVGGMNLFGRHFGDYAQDIVMKVEYA